LAARDTRHPQIRELVLAATRTKPTKPVDMEHPGASFCPLTGDSESCWAWDVKCNSSEMEN